eukprot:2958366-Karenia_brevis.AAC.1
MGDVNADQVDYLWRGCPSVKEVRAVAAANIADTNAYTPDQLQCGQFGVCEESAVAADGAATNADQ